MASKSVLRVEGDQALAIEEEGDGAAHAEAAVVLAEDVPHVGDGPGAVVGHEFHDDRHPAGTVSFEDPFLVIHPFDIAGALLDGPVDGVLGHVFGFGFIDGGAQARVTFRVAPADLGRHGDFLDELGENLSAFGVLCAFAVFDVRPLAVSCHDSKFSLYRMEIPVNRESAPC